MNARHAAVSIHLSALNVLDEAKAILASIQAGKSSPRNVALLRGYLADIAWGLDQLEAAPLAEATPADAAMVGDRAPAFSLAAE